MPHILIETMGRKRKLDPQDERNICNKLISTKLFEHVYHEVLSKLKEESCFKSLRNIGKHEMSNVTEASTQSGAQTKQKARLCYSKIHVLTAAIDDSMQNIIEGQFQNSSFLNEVKEEILKCLNEKQISAPPYHSLHKNYISGIKAENKLEAEKDGQQFVKSGENSFENFYNNTVSKGSLLDTSIDSVSSVHTSDLSSFDDGISISSDEGSGRKRKRISLKLVQEEIVKNKSVDESGMDVPKQKTSICEDAINSKISSPANDTDSPGVVQKSLPHRVRKPNAKYVSNYMISPFKIRPKESSRILSKKSISSAEKISVVPRKVGRPRKYPLNS